MSAYLYLVAELGHLRLQSNEVWEWKNFVTDFESSPCSVTLVGRWKEILRLGCVFSCNGAIWPCVCLRGRYLQSQVVIGWKGVSTPMRPGLDTGLYIGRAIALGLSHCDTVTVTLSHCHTSVTPPSSGIGSWSDWWFIWCLVSWWSVCNDWDMCKDCCSWRCCGIVAELEVCWVDQLFVVAAPWWSRPWLSSSTTPLSCQFLIFRFFLHSFSFLQLGFLIPSCESI